jgi:hypothetical protein
MQGLKEWEGNVAVGPSIINHESEMTVPLVESTSVDYPA